MEPFVNAPVTTAELPTVRDQDFTPIEAAYLRVSMVGAALGAGIVVFACVLLVATGVGTTAVIAAIGVAALAVLAVSAVLRALAVKRMGYLIRDHDISYRRGLVVASVSTIPFVRVQHARIRQGPIERFFGLATLEINSAGPDLHMPGLAADTAEQVKLVVVDRAGDLTEDE